MVTYSILERMLAYHASIVSSAHRHLRKIDWLMAHTACRVCLISTVNGRGKKKEKKAKIVALVAGHNKPQAIYFFFRYLWFCLCKKNNLQT